MALTQVYTAVALDVITAARWNNEFGNIYNNGTSLAFPLTTGVSLAGFTLTLDQAGVSSLSSTASQGLSFTPGSKAGTPSTTGSFLNIVAATFTDSNTAGSGTAAAFSATALQRPTLAATNSSVTSTDAATLYIANSPAAGTNVTITNPWAIWVDAGNVRFDGNFQVAGNTTLTGTTTLTGESTLTAFTSSNLLASKPIGGLTYAPAADASNDITVAIGGASSDDAVATARRFMNLTSAITGQIDTGTWVVGDAQPKLDTGSVADVKYYIWLIQRADTGVVDILFSASGTAPTMPTNYAYKRLIGWFNRSSSVNLAFTVREMSGGGIYFSYTTIVHDVNISATLTTSRRTDTLSVPIDFSVLAHVRIGHEDAGAAISNVGNPEETDAAPSATAIPFMNLQTHLSNVSVGYERFIHTSSTGTIYSRSNTATVDEYDVLTLGFEWSRR